MANKLSEQGLLFYLKQRSPYSDSCKYDFYYLFLSPRSAFSLLIFSLLSTSFEETRQKYLKKTNANPRKSPKNAESRAVFALPLGRGWSGSLGAETSWITNGASSLYKVPSLYKEKRDRVLSSSSISLFVSTVLFCSL